ncbi:hypothetical protein Agub_g5877, partial [Astrephomene gubernaculifera]
WLPPQEPQHAFILDALLATVAAGAPAGAAAAVDPNRLLRRRNQGLFDAGDEAAGEEEVEEDEEEQEEEGGVLNGGVFGGGFGGLGAGLFGAAGQEEHDGRALIDMLLGGGLG